MQWVHVAMFTFPCCRHGCTGATLGATLRGQRCGLHLIIVYDHKRKLVSRNNYVGNEDRATEQTGQDDMVSMRG